MKLVPGSLGVLVLVSATVFAWHGGSDAGQAELAGGGAHSEIRGFEDLRREAAEEQSRSSERSGEPTESPGDNAENEPEPPEGTVVPPSPATEEPDDDAEDESEQDEPAEFEPESSLPGGFPPVSGCDASIPSEGAVSNGQLGSEHLCEVGAGFRLRPDASAAFVAMAEAYTSSTGESLVSCIGNSYRTYEEQVDLYARKPNLAAEPGTSEHGWGLAIDFECGANSYSGSLYAWLDANGAEYGWINPAWARSDGSRPEPWHWEFTPTLLS